MPLFHADILQQACCLLQAFRHRAIGRGCRPGFGRRRAAIDHVGADPRRSDVAVAGEFAPCGCRNRVSTRRVGCRSALLYYGPYAPNLPRPGFITVRARAERLRWRRARFVPS
jgi:hypothetical protein